MKHKVLRVIASIILLLVVELGVAQEDDDLQLIPFAVIEGEAPDDELSKFGNDVFWENVLNYSSTGGAASQSFRSSLDSRNLFSLSPNVDFIFSGRVSGLLEESNQSDVEIALREAHFKIQLDEGSSSLKIGNMNLKRGVALSNNPTDYFRPSSQLTLNTSDPVELRNNRSGVFAINYNKSFDKWSADLVYVPELYDELRIDSSGLSFKDRLLGNNVGEGGLISLATKLGLLTADLSLFYEDSRFNFGTSLTYLVSDSIVTYFEWSGSDECDTFDSVYLCQTGKTELNDQFLHQYVVGASYSIATSGLTVNFEYISNEKGLDVEQRLTVLNDPSLFSLLEVDEQFLSRKSIFVRFSLNELFQSKANVTGFLFSDLDESVETYELNVNYPLNDSFDFNVTGNFNSGKGKFLLKDVPSNYSIFIGLRYYI